MISTDLFYQMVLYTDLNQSGWKSIYSHQAADGFSSEMTKKTLHRLLSVFCVAQWYWQIKYLKTHMDTPGTAGHGKHDSNLSKSCIWWWTRKMNFNILWLHHLVCSSLVKQVEMSKSHVHHTHPRWLEKLQRRCSHSAGQLETQKAKQSCTTFSF